VSELVGGRVSHYRIVSLLGMGGMGAVYRAHDERLGRDLALKVLLAESMADETARTRLIREAQTASSLNHPHIAHVYEVGEDEGRLFIAMELVEGRTLRVSIPAGGLPVESLLRHGLQISDALAYAHERGVIHRDLKSANIMITPEGWVKVLDFGLAKRLQEKGQEAGPSDATLTMAGIVLGTPSHLPPEVLMGGQADARSDIWALGVVLYEMASGKFPFSGGSLGELANAIVSDTPVPLSGRVPVGIQAIIGRCLAKEPSQRYQHANEVHAAIEALLGATTRGAVNIPRRVWLPAAAVVVAAVAVALAFGPGRILDRWAGRAGGPRIESLAVLPLSNLSGDPAQEYFADGMTEELITDLAPIQSLKVISRTSVMRFKNSKLPLRDIARTLGVDAIIEGSVLRAGDRVRITAQLIEASTDRHLWARSFERDFGDVLTLQGEVARDIAQEIRIHVTPEMKSKMANRRPINPQAYELYLKGRFEWNKLADANVRQAMKYYEQALAIDPGDARYSSGLADAYLLLVQVANSIPAREGMAKVKEYARQALAADPNSAEAHSSMAAALFFGDWNWAESERQVLRAIELNPGYSTAHLIYSVILAASGRLDAAIEQDRLAMELDPLSVIINWNTAATLTQARRYDDALKQANRTVELDSGSEFMHGSLLRIYEQTGNYKAALDLLERFLPESEGGKPFVAKLRREYAASGPTGYWRAVLDHALSKGTPPPGSEVRMAMFHAQLGERDRAIGYLERAFAQHSGDMVFIKVEPCFDGIRDDPRFQALVRRVGIP
jgi:TolB-like protein/tetratricopeptide (TPR) repeat protein